MAPNSARLMSTPGAMDALANYTKETLTLATISQRTSETAKERACNRTFIHEHLNMLASEDGESVARRQRKACANRTVAWLTLPTSRRCRGAQCCR
jgi:hypothetical protein